MNVSSLFDPSFTAPLTITLGHFLWQGAVVALLAWLVAATLRRATARVRYVVLVAALVVMASCPPVTFFVVNEHCLPLEKSQSASLPPPSPGETDTPPVEHSDQFVENLEPPASSYVRLQPDTITAPEAVSLKADVPLRQWHLQRFAPVAAAAYLTGVLILLGRLMLGLHGDRRLCRRSEPVEDQMILDELTRQVRLLGLRFTPAVAWCQEIAVPVVVGVLRPTILLPLSLATGLAPDQVAAILTHELAHIRRYDHLIDLAQRLIEAFLFFHPAVWWLSRRIRIEREHCCDDLVISLGATPIHYSESLLRVAELSQLQPGYEPVPGIVGLYATARPSRLRQRIARLLGGPAEPQVRLGRDWSLATAVLVILCTACVFLWSARADLQSSESETQAPIAGATRPLTDDALPQVGGSQTRPQAPTAIPAVSKAERGRDDSVPAIPTNKKEIESVRLIIKDGNQSKTLLDQETKFVKRVLYIKEPLSLPYARLEGISLELPKYDGGELHVDVSYLMTGDEKTDRRVLVDVKVLDDQSQPIYHDWELQEDQRIHARLHNEQRPAPREMLSHWNNASRYVPGHLVGQVRQIAIKLHEMYPEDYRHLPTTPRKRDLTMTRPNDRGEFEVSFLQPTSLKHFDPEKHDLVSRLEVRDAQDKIVRTEMKHADKPGADGRYRFGMVVEPEHLDHSDVFVLFYTRQSSGWTIEDFFEGKAHGAYRGFWLPDGGKLREIPFEDGTKGRRVNVLKASQDRKTEQEIGLSELSTRSKSERPHDKSPDEWGEERDGLRTRLVLLAEKPTVGKPLKFRLEMKNSGKVERHYDPQNAAPFRVMSVKKVDGDADPYIGPSYQTAGGPKPIKPGETVVLWDDYDAAEQFLLAEPGKYIVQTRGTRVTPPPPVPGLREPAESVIPASNAVTVELAPGTLPELKAMFVRMRKILPKERVWRISLSGRVIFFTHSPTSLKKDVTTIQLWFDEKEHPPGYSLGEGANKVEVDRLGRTKLGFAYLTVPEKAKNLWPEFREKIRAKLAAEQSAKPATDEVVYKSRRGVGRSAQPGEIVQRAERWEIKFPPDLSDDDYVRFLDFFKMRLAVEGGEQWSLVSQVSTTEPKVERREGFDERQLTFAWAGGSMRQADLSLVRKAGVAVSGNETILLVTPFETEQLLARLELGYLMTAKNHRDMRVVRRTRFRLRKVGDGYDFQVESQQYFGEPEPGNAAGGKQASAQFFGLRASGEKFVYVIDRSGSMSQRDRLGVAKRELLASLEKLPSDAQFQVILYNLRPVMMPVEGGAARLVPAAEANRAGARRFLESITADGGTEHVPALKMAIDREPDVVFFLTDSDDLRSWDVEQVTGLNKRHAVIHCIELGIGTSENRSNALRELANLNGGIYQYIDAAVFEEDQ